MEFKMERTGLLKEGDVLPVKESKVSSNFYYTLGGAFAMSANFPPDQRLSSKEGTVTAIRETPRGYYVTVQFDE